MKTHDNNLPFLNNSMFDIEEIDYEIEHRSLLKHPFYTMWTEGKLTVDHLRGYSKEYFQLVKAVPKFVENIYYNASTQLSFDDVNLDQETNDYRTKYLANIKQVQIEESEHTEPWINFALSLGFTRNEIIEYDGTKKVNQAINMLEKLSSISVLSGAAVMYSFEKEIPKISSIKIDGLEKFYGINSDVAVNYFKIHQTVDIKHAKLWETILTDSNIRALNDGLENDDIINTAMQSLQLQNLILDSVYEKYVCS
ncbi:MAG: TenA family transcriptional regulator [Nitrososphaerota archaeon]